MSATSGLPWQKRDVLGAARPSGTQAAPAGVCTLYGAAESSSWRRLKIACVHGVQEMVAWSNFRIAADKALSDSKRSGVLRAQRPHGLHGENVNSANHATALRRRFGLSAYVVDRARNGIDEFKRRGELLDTFGSRSVRLRLRLTSVGPMSSRRDTKARSAQPGANGFNELPLGHPCKEDYFAPVHSPTR